jgi:Phage integrase, N-terminal SAM-like domain
MQDAGTVDRFKKIGGVQSARPVSEARPKLLDQLREALRSRHCSRRTESTYCHWVKRFIYFHNVRHPAEMAEPQINAFLTHLAVKEKVSASTQNQALSALLFLLYSCPQPRTVRRTKPCGRALRRRFLCRPA